MWIIWYEHREETSETGKKKTATTQQVQNRACQGREGRLAGDDREVALASTDLEKILLQIWVLLVALSPSDSPPEGVGEGEEFEDRLQWLITRSFATFKFFKPSFRQF